MKKTNKRIPKTHLPKFTVGGGNYNEFGYNAETPVSGSSTEQLFNKKRGMSSDDKNAVYGAIGAAGDMYANVNNQNAYSQPDYVENNSSQGKWQGGKTEGMADVVQSGVGKAIPIAGMFHGLSEAAQSAVGTKGANAGSHYFWEPHTLITDAIDKKGLFNSQDRESHGLGWLNNIGRNIFAMGGINQAPNSEIEKQENVVAPDGSFMQADGPSHENGGIPVNLPGNAKVFSDKLKMPGTKKTFADLNKTNNTNKEDKILDSTKHSSMSKHTAELMKLAKNKNSDTLFNEQESFKQAKVQAYAKRMGVTLPSTDNEQTEPQGQSEASEGEYRNGGMLPKYANGIKTVPTINWDKPASSYQYGQPRFLSNGQLDQTDSLSRVKMNVDNNSTSPYQTQEPFDFKAADAKQQSEIDAVDNYIPQTEKQGTNWNNVAGNIASFAANNAGNIYNLSRYNKPEIEKYDRMKATYLDPSASLRDADQQNSRAEYNVRGASGGNAGTYLSNRVALAAQNTENKDRINKEYQNANAGIANSVGQYNNELSRAEVIANAQNRARTRSGTGEAIGSMGSNIANQMRDNKKTNMDQNTLELMMKYYNTPEFQKMMKDNKFKQ